MNYKIKYTNPTQQYIEIEAQFVCKEEEEIKLQFPAWRPGRYELGNFAKNIRHFSIVDEKGKNLSFTKNSKDNWTVKCKGASKISVHYFYYANELNAGSTYMDDSQLYVNPVNCLIYREDHQNEACTLALDVPSHFELACGAKHKDNVIYCEDYHELVDTPFISSPSMTHKTYVIFGITFHLWFQGEVNIDWAKTIKDFELFTKKQIEKFSNKKTKTIGFPVDEYHFLYQILPIRAYHGVEHKTSTVIALGPTNQLMHGLYDDFLGVSSHELYHCWNIKSIRPVEMYPYNYAKENYSELGYIAEGVTTYLGDVFLAEANVKPFAWYKKELEKLLQKHFDNFGRFNYSVAESSWDTWLDGYVKGAPYRKVSIYNEGALMAFVTDMMIREGSENRASIHDVMNDLYLNFAQKGKGYTEEDYIKYCEKHGKVDFRELFKNFIHGTMPYESVLVKALETMGFTLEMKENNKSSERIIGIKTILVENKTIIDAIFPGSSAEMGALMIGDEIISINNLQVDKNIDALVAFFEERSLQLRISRKGRILELNCPNTNRSMYPSYFIQKMAIPSGLNKRIFKKWIGYKWEDC